MTGGYEEVRRRVRRALHPYLAASVRPIDATAEQWEHAAALLLADMTIAYPIGPLERIVALARDVDLSDRL